MNIPIKGEYIGSVIGETSPTQVTFVVENPRSYPKLGEYIVIDYSFRHSGRQYVLAMIEYLSSSNPLAPENISNPYVIQRLRQYEETTTRTYVKGVARLLSYIDTLLYQKPYLETPKYPPPPFSMVFKASTQLLHRVFSKEEKGWIRIGVLASNPEVPYSINVNYIMQRHLAILAVTGAGKSNTVALIASRIVDQLNGTVLIFDMHSEYSSSTLTRKTNIIQPKLNPLYLDVNEFIQLLHIPPHAWRQEYLARTAFLETQEKYLKDETGLEPNKFFDELMKNIEKIRLRMRSKSEWERASLSIINKINDLVERYKHIFEYTLKDDLTYIIKPGFLNIMDLGEVDEDAADVVVHHYLRKLYYERKMYVREKKGYPDPVLVVVEEAHILVPRNENRLTKYWVSRIAREGRKFGIGLCLVSQRPKVVDENALSQTNNKIILRLVEPNDLRYVQYVSEYMSDELLKILPGLNVGEAIVLGLMTTLPAIVKIDECPGKSGGKDIDAVKEWSSKEQREQEEKRIIEDAMDLAGL